MIALGLDFGERYVGVALSDPDGKFAVRYGTIDQRETPVFDELTRIITKEGVTTLVVGVPVGLSGNETEQTRVVRAFIDELQSLYGEELAIREADETLTSVEAARQIAYEGAAKLEEHAEAARLILSDYLASLHR